MRRAIRHWGGHALRRLGMVPSGIPDGLGEDELLCSARLEQDVMVYFPETPENLYQLRQWYEPLRELDRTHPVVIMVQDSRVARAVRSETALPVIAVGRSSTLDGLLARSDVTLVLYVGHAVGNFTALRHTSSVHVFLSHGESDKAISVSNQVKAYDFFFVAGQAAIDRHAAHVMLFDPKEHLVPIGRPQIDAYLDGRDRASSPPGARTVVLYAPTWEGAQPSAAYGSAVSHGRALVEALLAAGDIDVVYRPHPRTGANDERYQAADAAIRRRLLDPAERAWGARHTVDTAPSPADSFRRADLMIADVSAIVIEWLPTFRPMIVTVPSSPAAQEAATRILDVVPRLRAEDVAGVVELVRREVGADPRRDDRVALCEYYLGDTSPGAATRAFVGACSDAISRCRDERARLARTGGAG